MKTNFHLWIFTLLLLAISVGVLVWQRTQMQETRHEIKILEERIAGRSESAMNSRRSSSHVASVEAKTVLPVRARLSAVEFLELLPENDGLHDMGSTYRILLDLLEEIKDYSSEEILELLEKIGELSETKGSQAMMMGMLKGMLVTIAVEEVPERILEMMEEDRDQTLRAIAFAGLARKNLKRAQQFLREVDWPAKEVQSARASLFGEWLKKDPEKALEMIRRDQSGLLVFSGGIISEASRDPDVRRKLWAATEVETDAVVRQELAKGLLIGEFIRNGASAMREAMAAADFLEPALKSVIVREFAGEMISSDPDGAYQWIQDSLPAEEVSKALAKAVGSWAKEDLNAAGTWLQNRPSSPEWDQAIGAFAKTVVAVDPVTAAVWAASIKDETFRQTALGSVLGSWSAKDSDAAAAWADENDIEINQFPGVLQSVEE